MATFKHFNGDEQLVRVVPVDSANGYCFTALVSCQEDRAASVRRAVVRAAADIAKSSGGEQ